MSGPYVQDAAGKPSTADELRQLVAVRDEGAHLVG